MRQVLVVEEDPAGSLLEDVPDVLVKVLRYPDETAAQLPDLINGQLENNIVPRYCVPFYLKRR